METAVVFIEFQNEFTTPGGKLHDAVKDCMDSTGTLPNAQKVASAARAAGCTIVHCPIAFEKVRSLAGRDTFSCVVHCLPYFCCVCSRPISPLTKTVADICINVGIPRFLLLSKLNGVPDRAIKRSPTIRTVFWQASKMASVS